MPNSFEIQIEEWGYLDGKHKEEIAYAVLESGLHVLPETPYVLECGNVPADSNWTSVQFDYPKNGPDPVFVCSQCQTENGSDEVVARQRGIHMEGMEVRLQEAEARKGGHTIESVGWVKVLEFELPENPLATAISINRAVLCLTRAGVSGEADPRCIRVCRY